MSGLQFLHQEDNNGGSLILSNRPSVLARQLELIIELDLKLCLVTRVSEGIVTHARQVNLGRSVRFGFDRARDRLQKD